MTLIEQFEKESGMKYPKHDMQAQANFDELYEEWLERRVSKWIDVNDRLPDLFKRVLVTDGIEITQAYLGHVKNTFQGQFLLNEEWMEKPTHWAELPYNTIIKRGTEAEP